ncbi:MAG: sensor histidine kinase N-terminal domain-containing protein [Betaproteobacteria bacterium]|nr:sensor histidine kinase N-terminal domain-containing protein [Betaproteobacteria bacterium]
MSARGSMVSLRRRLLTWLLVPLLAIWVFSAVIAYYFAYGFATLAYDNALFESTLDVARQVKVAGGEVRLDLPREALDMLESDKHDRVYYMVTGPKGEFVSGHVGLPLPAVNTAPGKPGYYDATYRGTPVRVAALQLAIDGRPENGLVLVQVAETLNKRHALANEILFGMLLPALLLIAVAAMVVWYGIGRGLKPLTVLSRALRTRSHRDLSPLPEEHAPAEVRPVVRALNDLLARLGEALSAQQRFIADAAHQLRTPLAGMKTQTELALRHATSGDVRHALQQIHAATAHTAHLVHQLLALARAEPGKPPLEAFERIDLDRLARDTATEWVPRAVERNIDLGFDGAANGARVSGDPFLLREMLANLLDNAIRYTQPGGSVTVRVALEGDRIALSVEDNGPGVPEQERERVFERFHRVLGSGADGCGLGLAIVREIAEGHGAEISLGSGGGAAGTVVKVAFPGAA